MHKETNSPCPHAAYILGRETDNTRKKMSLVHSLPYVMRTIGKMGKGTEELGGCDSIRLVSKSLEV